MKVSPVYFAKVSGARTFDDKKDVPASQNQYSSSLNGSSAYVSTMSALSQMPNISFGKSKTLSANDEIEIQKQLLTDIAERDLKSGRKVEALEKKLQIAKLCKEQGQEYNAFLLEDGVRDLYKNMRPYERDSAIEAIRKYNPDMAENIDKDIVSMEKRREDYFDSLKKNEEHDASEWWADAGFCSLGDMASYYPQCKPSSKD